MRLRHSAFASILAMFLSILFISMGMAGDVSRLEKALEAAGENRAELETVLGYYSGEGLENEYAAAVFLIENMEGHSYVTYNYHDSSGQEIPFDVLAYPDFDSLLAAVRVIENKRGEFDYRRNRTAEDLTSICADFLIEQIDYAFRAWREKPWAQFLTFEEFCEFVLPYRGSNEPLESWRGFFFEKFTDIPGQMSDSTDPIEAASLINNDVMSWFLFDPRYYFHPTDQGFAEMMRNKMGRCEDMTNITIYAMRANGLAVTSDFTPFWANSGNNHAWNAILTPGGKVIPFMGAEQNPGSYRLANKLAKVYRKTFAVQPGNLIFQERKQDKIPSWLGGKNYVDVTADYTDVADVAVKFEPVIPDSVDIAYLCVFNSGEWRAIHWARIDNAVAIFGDMGVGIAYLPALYLDEEMVPFGPPFILSETGDVNPLLRRPGDGITVELVSTTSRKQKVSTDGIVESSLTPGETYELMYWSDGWQSFAKSKATGEPLKFDNVPSGVLYWLVAENSDKEERVFTIKDGRQVWW